MCDYSLHAVASRPATTGDRLVTTHFSNSITRGLAGVTEPQVAVCLLPGTEVAFDQEVAYQHVLGWFRDRRTKGRVARFRQVNTANPHTHHDAFEFPDGKLVMVTRLIENQNLTVLQLPVAANDAARQADVSTAPAQAARGATGAMVSGRAS
jgi:hypothetical protein